MLRFILDVSNPSILNEKTWFHKYCTKIDRTCLKIAGTAHPLSLEI